MGTPTTSLIYEDVPAIVRESGPDFTKKMLNILRYKPVPLVLQTDSIPHKRQQLRTTSGNLRVLQVFCPGRRLNISLFATVKAKIGLVIWKGFKREAGGGKNEPLTYRWQQC